MLGFVQNWFSPRHSPIGVDFGSDQLRLAQVHRVDGDWRLMAAASIDVPGHVRNDPNAKLLFFAENIRDVLREGKFSGRSVILGLPAWAMHIQHLRMPKIDEATLKRTLPFEARGKLPIDPARALLRHLVAGEVYDGQESKLELVILAAARDWVDRYLAAVAKAKLEVIGMNVEPQVVVDCFHQIYRRKNERDATFAFIDIGAVGTRVTISQAGTIRFARSIPVGGDHLTRAAADALKISYDQAKILRIQMASIAPAASTAEMPTSMPRPDEQAAGGSNSFALLNASLSAANRSSSASAERRPAVPNPRADVDPESAEAGQMRLAQAAGRPIVQKMVEEIDLCRRYYESTFPSAPINRLVFVGGEARQRGLCQQIARELNLAAQIGDPLIRMGKHCDISSDSGIEVTQPQPGWTVAIGLSMGAAGTTAAEMESEAEPEPAEVR